MHGGDITDLQKLKQVEELLDKQALHELNARYCMGVDRRDRALLLSLWMPEATIDFGLFKGNASKFCDLISQDNPQVAISHHFASNELFMIDGQKATGQSYVIGATRNLADSGNTDQLTGGRYLDQYKKIEGRWLFSSRVFVVDWLISLPESANWDEGIAALAKRGHPSLDDLSYSFDKMRN